jgi:hypothetical protein
MNMRHTIITIFLALFMVSTASAQYEINGKLDGLKADKMYLEIHGEVADSAVVAADGTFHMKSREPMQGANYVALGNDKARIGIAFWLFNDKVNVTMHGTGAYEVTGAKVEDEYRNYLAHMTPLWDKERAELAIARKDLARSGELSDSLAAVWLPREDSLFMIWARKHPKSYVSLNHIYNKRNMDKYPYSRYMKMMAALDTTAFEGRQWETMREIIADDRALEPGQPFPSDIDMPDAYGDTLRLSDLRGKYVLITLSSSPLGDYLADVPLRKELYANLHDKGLEMVDVLLDDAWSSIIRQIAFHGMKWTAVCDLKGWGSPFVDALHIDHITQNWIVGPDGKIIRHNVFGTKLKESLESLLK